MSENKLSKRSSKSKSGSKSEVLEKSNSQSKSLTSEKEKRLSNKSLKSKNESEIEIVEMTESQCRALIVESYGVEINQAYTAVCLLESPEDDIVILSLCTLDILLQKNEIIGIFCLEKRNLLIRLLNVLDRAADIAKVALKILMQIMKQPETMLKIQSDIAHFNPIINSYIINTDVVVLEYSAYVLDNICTTEEYADPLCRLDLIDQILKNVNSIKDIDVKHNSLRVLLRIVYCYRRRFFISESNEFQITLFKIILSHNIFYDLQYITLDILGVVSSWEVPEMIRKLRESNILPIIFALFHVETWGDLQNKGLTVIHNILNHAPVQTKILESNEFLNFINLCKKSSAEHALACYALIVEFAKETENREIMLDLGIIDVLVQLCQHECDLIAVKFCEAISEFSKNIYIAEKLLSRSTLQRIAGVLNKKHLPWDPYRQAGILPLYYFSLYEPKLGLELYRNDVLKFLMDALMNRKELSKASFKMVMSLFNTLFMSKAMREHLLTKELFKRFLNMCRSKDEDVDIIKIVLDICISSIKETEYREWFIEFKGITTFTSLFLRQNSEFQSKLIIFFKLAVKYRKLAFILLVHGMVPILKYQMEYDIHLVSLYTDIINDIYRCDATIKFHDLDYLDVHDVIDSGFCIFIGSKQREFPPNVCNKLSTGYTVLTLNFSKKVKQLIPIFDTPREDISSISSGDDPATTMKNMLDSYVVLSNEAILQNAVKDTFFLKIPLPESKQQEDYYLSRLLEHLMEIINPIQNLLEKIRAIADFINTNMGGHFGDYPTKYQYETHIFELKKKLKSNYIPLGFIKMGQKVERAMLFKAFADKLKIPCTLQRSDRYCVWNEIPIFPSEDFSILRLKSHVLQYFVVDLMDNVGALLPKDSEAAEAYCEGTLVGDLSSDTRSVDSKLDFLIEEEENNEYYNQMISSMSKDSFVQAFESPMKL